MVYVLAVLAIIVLAFVAWRHGSVARGARQRDERLLTILDPIAVRLSKKEPVTAEEIAELAKRPQLRRMLFRMLENLERLDLFPTDALNVPAQGAGALAYWMMHPNELQDAPAEIELV